LFLQEQIKGIIIRLILLGHVRLDIMSLLLLTRTVSRFESCRCMQSEQTHNLQSKDALEGITRAYILEYWSCWCTHDRSCRWSVCRGLADILSPYTMCITSKTCLTPARTTFSPSTPGYIGRDSSGSADQHQRCTSTFGRFLIHSCYSQKRSVSRARCLAASSSCRAPGLSRR